MNKGCTGLQSGVEWVGLRNKLKEKYEGNTNGNGNEQDQYFMLWTIMIISTISTIVSILLELDVLAVIFSGTAALSGIIALCIIIRRWQKEKNASREHEKDSDEYETLLSDPFEMHFLIPTRKKYNKIGYHEQDDEEHLVDELKIASGTEDIVFLWIKPRITIELGERYFGFKSEGEEKKPELRYCNPFVKEESKTPDYYIDWHDYYHIYGSSPEQRIWRVGEVYNPAFKIMTHDKGDFIFQAIYHINGVGYNQITEKRYKVVTKQLKLVCLDREKEKR